jgi:hypothetical protein
MEVDYSFEVLSSYRSLTIKNPAVIIFDCIPNNSGYTNFSGVSSAGRA